jgi:Kef-type K+ transport system membrane component KefB
MIDAAGLEAFRKLPIDELLVPLLVQLAVILLTARLFAVLARRVGQPAVVGEIVAGLVLGPSILKPLAPAVWSFIFRPHFHDVPHELSDLAISNVLGVLSQLGLILLLFLVGLEFDFGHLRHHSTAALSISVAGIALPLVLGLSLAPLIHPFLEPHPESGAIPSLTGFALFLGVALAITAIPVLARIMIELNITHTRLGTITITAAAADDMVGWILLATVSAVVRSQFSPSATGWMIAESAAFVLGMIFLVRPILKRWVKWALSGGTTDFGIGSLAVLLSVLFGCSVLTALIGIFAVFGAFILGAILSDEEQFREAVSAKLRDIVNGFLLPIFFTSTGLRTQVGSLGSWSMVGWFLAVLAAGVVGKLVGCGLAARFSGLTTRESACVGAMMNTRGLMALIVVNLGYELRVIPPSVFCMLVLVALGTTMMTVPLLRRWSIGTELEGPIHGSADRDGRPQPDL